MRAEKKGDAVVVECELAEPPEKVWRALTVPDLLAAWLAPNDMRAEPGDRFTLRAGPREGGAIRCEVLAVEPNRLLRYRWRGGETERDGADRLLDTVVTFELTETEAGGTRLRLVHSGFPMPARAALRPAGSVPDGSATCMAARPFPRRTRRQDLRSPRRMRPAIARRAA